MSWTDIFPVMDDEHVDQYLSGRSAADLERYEEWFGIQQFIQSSTRVPTCVESSAPLHVVSTTLFWKHVMGADPDLPKPTRTLLSDARRLGLVKRFSPWDSYVAPLLLHTPTAVERHPGVRFRLYLASDLEFLIPELSEAGWDICLMKSPSIRYCPGGFWRFLALEDRETLVTVIDTDRMREVSGEICRTEEMHRMGLGLWRVPGYYNVEPAMAIRYRPILGGHFGAFGDVPMRLLIEAFLWHSERGTLSKTAMIPGVGERSIHFTQWPDYGFDEWFQLAVLYPRLVPRGALTFIPKDARSMFLPVDLEYVQWANPASESLYF